MNPADLTPADFNRFVLDKTRVGTQLSVDSYTLNSMCLEVENDIRFLTDDLVIRLEAFVLQDKLPPKTVTETKHVTTPPVPATWWDHFKHDYKDRTWLKHLIVHLKPPLYKVGGVEVGLTVDLERWVSYPEAQKIPETFGRQYHGCNVSLNWWEDR